MQIKIVNTDERADGCTVTLLARKGKRERYIVLRADGNKGRGEYSVWLANVGLEHDLKVSGAILP